MGTFQLWDIIGISIPDIVEMTRYCVLNLETPYTESYMHFETSFAVLLMQPLQENQ